MLEPAKHPSNDTSTGDLIRRLHEHRAWVNDRLMDAAHRLPEEALHRELPVGQGTIFRTLCHLWAAEYVWLGVLRGNPQPLPAGDRPGEPVGSQRGPGGVTTLEELIERWRATETDWREYLQSPELPLAGVVYKRSSRAQPDAPTPPLQRTDVLLHVCLHAQYTTAQLCNMLRQVEAEAIPDVMLVTMAREQTGGERAGGGTHG